MTLELVTDLFYVCKPRVIAEPGLHENGGLVDVGRAIVRDAGELHSFSEMKRVAVR